MLHLMRRAKAETLRPLTAEEDAALRHITSSPGAAPSRSESQESREYVTSSGISKKQGCQPRCDRKRSGYVCAM